MDVRYDHVRYDCGPSTISLMTLSTCPWNTSQSATACSSAQGLFWAHRTPGDSACISHAYLRKNILPFLSGSALLSLLSFSVLWGLWWQWGEDTSLQLSPCHAEMQMQPPPSGAHADFMNSFFSTRLEGNKWAVFLPPPPSGRRESIRALLCPQVTIFSQLFVYRQQDTGCYKLCVCFVLL